MDKPLMIHLVGYLAASLVHSSVDDEEVVVMTIRPDAGSWRPHNIGITRPEAERLLADLKRLLIATPLLLILFLSVGCSARVQVTTENFSPPQSAERSSTVVAVEILTDLSPLDHAAPKEENTVELTGNGNTVVIVAGDLHLHQHTHIHRHEAPARIESPPATVRIEFSPPKRDPVCERLLREHEDRVREWKAMLDATRKGNRFSITGDSK